MRKHRPLIVLTLPLLFFIACSSNDESTPADPGQGPPGGPSTILEIRTGLWPGGDMGGLVTTMPAGIASVDFTITTTDSTIVETATVEGGVASLSVTVPLNGMLLLRCEANDDSGTIVFHGVRHALASSDLDTLFMNMADVMDVMPPVLGGSLNIAPLSTGALQLDWDPATEDGAPSAMASYLVYAADKVALPLIATCGGVTSAVVGGLQAGTAYSFVVKAIDTGGNVSVESLNQSATTHGGDVGLYVDVMSGVDSPTCGSLGSPCKTITQALSLSPGDEPIFVASGTYSESTGESFPLELKPGTQLVGEVLWPRGIPLTRLSFGQVAAAITCTDEAGMFGFRLEPNAGSVERFIDARGAMRLSHLHLDDDGGNSTFGVSFMAGGEIKHSTIEGFAVGRGIGHYSREPLLISDCVIQDCSNGISIQGHHALIYSSIVRDCITGIVAWSLDPGDTDDIAVIRCLIRHCNDGVSVTDITGLEIGHSLIWQNNQMGIHLNGVDATTVIRDNTIDSNPTGIYLRRGLATIHHNAIVCNRVNLFVGGSDQVTAAQNSWDQQPPHVTNRPDDEPCVDCDICYDGHYAETPIPISEPSYARTPCLLSGYVPMTRQTWPVLLTELQGRAVTWR